MKGTLQVIKDNKWEAPTDWDAGSYYYRIMLPDGYELCLEPLLFDKFYFALYKDGQLVTEKIPGGIVKGGDDE